MRIAGKATKGKGKRWSKGGSSSCNPHTNRHRVGARNTSHTTSSAAPKTTQWQRSMPLSEDVLHQHNLTHFQKLGLDNLSTGKASDAESIGGQSFASVWTNCSNISFNKLLTGFNSSSAIHKQMLSVLAAVTETITSNGGSQTETEYFAALMTCLETAEIEETLTAILSLIQMVIKRLPQNVIRLKFSETSKVLVDYLAKYIKGDNCLIIESITNSLASLLQQQENAVWELSSTKHIFEIILSLTVHNKGRIRKCSQRSIARILKTNTNQSKSSFCHPIAKLTADFCLRKLEDHGINDNINSTLYVLNLLTDILSVLPNACLKKCCESILTQMTFGNVLVVSQSFKAFNVLFSANPHKEILTPDLNARLISALYDYQPNVNDSQPLCAWIEAIKQAFLNLYRIDQKLCFNHLPKLMNAFIACLLTDAKEVHLNVTNNLKQIYSHCIEPSSLEIDKQIIERVYSSIEKALQYEYFNAYIPIFALISHFLNENFAQYMSKIIIKLITIRESYDNAYASNIDRTIGRAIQVFSPKFIINLCPLDLNEENTDVSHNWLIPVLRDNVKETDLAFFIDYFIPMATVLRKTCQTLESNGNVITAKTCSILLSQIWSLLPSFCNRPKDFDNSFKRIAKTLGDIISHDHSLRKYVLTAFKNLSKCFDSPSGQPLRTELSRFSKNFIPILFNVYTNEENLADIKNQLFNIYEIIEIFFSVSENSLLISFYEKIIEKLQNSENSPVMRQSLMDLIRAFIPYIRKNNLKQIYSQLVVVFIGDNKLITEQKKAFRILEEICRSDSIVCKKFVSNNLNELLTLLIGSLSTCLSSSKSYPLKALKEIISNNENQNNPSIEWRDIYIEMITKSMNCLQINSHKVKTAAMDLIVGIANAHKILNSGDVNDLMEIMITLMKSKECPSSAVIICLTRLYSQFRQEIHKHVESELIENIITSLGSDNRQIIQTALDFVKYFFRTASLDQLSTYLELLISNLSNINRKHKNHFRVKIKEMFIRLVRKYGYLMISKMIPEEYRKVLKNIRKVEERKKRFTEDNESDRQTNITTSKVSRKEFEDIIANSSDEESEEDDQMTSVSRKDVKSWMKDESNENEIIDLLSSKMSQNILHKNPELKPKEKKEAFEFSSDGKLVIQDLDKRGTKRGAEEDEDMDQNEDIDDDMVSNKQSVKTSNSRQSNYKTGGKGIHRAVDKEFGGEYRSNKAKGDMKRKGKPDPFAYIPLNRQTLNKRKKAKLSGRFNNLVTAARKGAKVGSQRKSKKGRKH